MNIINKKICLKEFIPNKVLCGKDASKSYELKISENDLYLTLSYEVNVHNHLGCVGKRQFTEFLPKYIRKNQETFEVLGLLQAEMGKKYDGRIVFCNHEYQLVNKVIKWFDKEFNFKPERWNWYIKVNINEPLDKKYKKEVEDKVINYWIKKAGLSLEESYPKKVSYIKNTKNKKLKFYDYGTLIIERKVNLFSQVIKNFVKKIFYNILNYEEDEIRKFMKGIIAGESNVEFNLKHGHYRIFISAKELEERELYQNCLNKLGINSTVYPNFHGVVISKKQNNLKLLKQKLMTLSPKKYNKFLRMMNLYEDFKGLKEWRNNLQKPYNKIPQEKIDKIIELHHEHSDWPAWKIAEIVGVSAIKVARVRKEHGLGKQIVKHPESKRKEIAEFAKENLNLIQEQIAKHFKVHESVVRRACKKYCIKRGNISRCKIPEEKIQRIIEIYKQNPTVKVSEIMKEVGISNSVIKRVRRENNLTHLGYKYLIGCNNPSKKYLNARS